MSIPLTESVNYIAATASELLNGRAHIALTGPDTRRILNERNIAVWVPPPEKITASAPGVYECEFNIAIVNPRTDNIIAALQECADIALTLSTPELALTAINPDILTIDGGAPAPGILAPLTLTIGVDE